MPRQQAAGEKTAYERKAEAKLEETRAKVDTVRARIKGAVAEGQIEADEQLRKIDGQLDGYLDKAREGIARVKDASDDMWEDVKDEVEETWEDLAHAVKRLVERLSK